MKKQLSDEQIDRMLSQILADASVNEDDLVDIASSPATWWAVQRSINQQKETRSPWPPANVIRRWLLIGVPTFAAVFIALFFVFSKQTPVPETARIVEPTQVQQPLEPTDTPKAEASQVIAKTEDTKPTFVAAKAEKKVTPATQRAVRREIRSNKLPQTLTARNEVPSEIKTEFIALTYARNADSGQVVRVKVPRSMMVSLGLVASVEKPADLVDAEVLVGDDGLTRAIRFINKQ